MQNYAQGNHRHQLEIRIYLVVAIYEGEVCVCKAFISEV